MKPTPPIEAPLSPRASLLRDGVEVFPAVLETLANARVEVLVEMYWFDDSPVARRVIETLTERARAGVAVRVSYDAIGSLGANSARFDALIAAGARVIEYNPIAP